ncbi:MAG: hypothetical protein NTV51_21810 [Verrucomicrobia bacterium]|nr:hypothetical protein [Verrucomicrobiota bacterium]
MKANFLPLSRTARLATGTILICTGCLARGASKPEVDAMPLFESYIKVSGQAPSISGDSSAFQARTKQNSNGGAGIEDLHIAKDLSKTTALTIDGRALTGAEDYLGRFNVTKTDVGSVDVGYKRFRTFYDGVGGFFPLNSQWLPLADQDLHIDRSKFWAEAKLALKDMPVFEVRYTNELRSGRKDSTIWGDSDLTGLAFNLAPNPVSPARKFTPSYLQVGERHQLIEATVKHTIGKTSLQFTLLGDQTNNSDTRYVMRFPGEVIPWTIASLATAAQPAAKAAVAATNWNNQVAIAETEAQKTKTSGFNATSDTIINDKLTLRFGANYELVHTEIGGGRPLVTTTPTATGAVLVATDNYQGLSGGTRVKDYTGNVALDYKATKTVFVKLALRAQSEFIRGSSSYNVIAASGTPATTVASTPRTGWAKIHQNVRTPVLELRYTGIKDVALYFNGSKRDLSGVETNTSSYNPLTAALGTPAANNVSEDHGNYTLGANWRQSAFLTLRAEVFQKGHKDNTVGFGTAAAIVGDYYLLDSNYEGYKLSALARVTPQFGFTTRLVSQHGRMKVTGFLPTYPAYDSLNSKNYMISETIDWNPNKNVYVQLNGNLTYNVISTIYPRAGLTPATATLNAFDSNRILQNSDNNYVTFSGLTGFAVDKLTNLEIQANLYRAQNGNAILAPLTMPYGVQVEDTSITVGVKRKFSDSWVANAKVGYFESKNDTTGGRTNFHGPVAYLSFEHAL